MTLALEQEARNELWRHVVAEVERYADGLRDEPIAAESSPKEIKAMLASCDFMQPLEPNAAIDFVVAAMRRYQTHTGHPGYFGLFNPAVTTMGVAADTLTAAFNPQLAAWNHAPFAVEVEQHLVRAFAARFGYDAAQCDGTFTSGGSEANHTAVLTALQHSFPQFAAAGLRALPAQPVCYLSAEGHHSLVKAVRLCGLGTEALRFVPVDARLRMDADALRALIARDRRAGYAPFLLIGTAGTTSAGLIDPLAELADIAAQERLWFHVDAAWGGAVVLATELRPLLAGIERANSLTFDAHKWLSAPVGAGLYLTRHPRILHETFQVLAGYMPPNPAEEIVNPYMHSMQWSRRFIGLKVFLSLAVAGWEGYAATIRRMVMLGDLLRERLTAADWQIVNDTALPVICFLDRRHPQGGARAYLERIARAVVQSGSAWISTTQIGAGAPVLRACISSFHTGTEDVAALLEELETARANFEGERF